MFTSPGQRYNTPYMVFRASLLSLLGWHPFKRSYRLNGKATSLFWSRVDALTLRMAPQ